MTTPWMNRHPEYSGAKSHPARGLYKSTREALAIEPVNKTQREADRKPTPVKFRFDESKIQKAHEAYLKEKENTRINSNQYGYAGSLRRVG